MSRHAFWGAVALLCAALAFIPEMAAFSQWHDEVIAINAAINLDSPADLYSLDEPQMIVHPPLFFLLLKGWRALVGRSDTSLRALTVLLMILAAAFIFRIAADFSQRARGGFAAVLMFSAMGFIVQYSHTTHNYALLTCAAVAYLFFYERFWLRRPSPYTWLWVLVSFVALIYTHYYALFWLAILNFYGLLLSRGKWRQLQRWLLIHVIGVLCFLPWLPVFNTLRSGRYDDANVGDTSLPTNWTTVWDSLATLLYDGQGIFAGLVLVALAALLIYQRDRRKIGLLIAVTGGVFALALASNLILPTYNPRRVIYVLAGLAILTGYGLATLPRPLYAAGLIAVLLLTPNFPMPVYIGGDFKFRQTLEYVESHAQPNDLVFINYNHILDAKPLTYYAATILTVPYRVEGDPIANIDNMMWARERLWVITAPEKPIIWDEVQAEKQYMEIERTQIGAMQIQLFEATLAPDMPTDLIRLDHALLPQVLGGNFVLADAQINTLTAAPGDTLTIWLTWEMRQFVDQDYSFFVHLIEDDLVTLHGQIDSAANHLGRPLQTTFWATNTPVYDQRTLVIDPNTPPGIYNLRVGIYSLRDGIRLTAEPGDSTGSRDGVIVGRVEIR